MQGVLPGRSLYDLAEHTRQPSPSAGSVPAGHRQSSALSRVLGLLDSSVILGAGQAMQDVLPVPGWYVLSGQTTHSAVLSAAGSLNVPGKQGLHEPVRVGCWPWPHSAGRQQGT